MPAIDVGEAVNTSWQEMTIYGKYYTLQTLQLFRFLRAQQMAFEVFNRDVSHGCWRATTTHRISVVKSRSHRRLLDDVSHGLVHDAKKRSHQAEGIVFWTVSTRVELRWTRYVVATTPLSTTSPWAKKMGVGKLPRFSLWECRFAGYGNMSSASISPRHVAPSVQL